MRRMHRAFRSDLNHFTTHGNTLQIKLYCLVINVMLEWLILNVYRGQHPEISITLMINDRFGQI